MIDAYDQHLKNSQTFFYFYYIGNDYIHLSKYITFTIGEDEFESRGGSRKIFFESQFSEPPIPLNYKFRTYFSCNYSIYFNIDFKSIIKMEK